MAKGYINSSDQVFKDKCDYGDIKEINARLAEAFMWVNLINKNQDFLLVLVPDIIKKTDLPLNEELIKSLKNYE
jgi:hypothetical protein